jgi:AraC-like DNA-binding protein
MPLKNVQREKHASAPVYAGPSTVLAKTETQMVRKTHKPTVSLDLVRMFARCISAKGLDFDEISTSIGMAPSLFEKSDGRISGRRFEAMWNEAADRSGDPDFGLHLGEDLAETYAGGHVLFFVMKNCPTVGEAMKKFFRYHCILADTVQPVLNLCGDLAHISWDAAPGLQAPRHPSEALLSMFTGILRHITENHPSIVEVRFVHPGPDDTEEHERIFNAALCFERGKNELVVRKSAMDMPIFMANSELLHNLETFVSRLLHRFQESNAWSQKVSRLLGEMILRGETFGIDAVADSLALGVRTLQNRLRKERATYRMLLDRVRKQIAQDYLARGEATVCDIAFLLGFSEQSAFNHAFRRWTGSTPLEYIREKGSNPDKDP